MVGARKLFGEISAEVGFSGDPLDRLSSKRDDAEFVRGLQSDPRARTLVFARDMVVHTVAAGAPHPWFTLGEAATLGAGETALLGAQASGPVFATRLDDSASQIMAPPDEGGFADRRIVTIRGRPELTAADLRSLTLRGLFDRPTTAMIAAGKSLFYWHARNRFCSVCGAPSRLAAAGWRRECGGCEAKHFPRTDPVVIMLAIDGDRCLLGRQPRFPKGMYSALAGFLEPGETIEEAARREILEETGVRCGHVSFIGSQPWPFPASLMIGCFVKALSTGIVIDHTELEDARWFARAEARAMLDASHPAGLAAPQPLAIAHHLLRAWVLEA